GGFPFRQESPVAVLPPTVGGVERDDDFLPRMNADDDLEMGEASVHVRFDEAHDDGASAGELLLEVGKGPVEEKGLESFVAGAGAENPGFDAFSRHRR